MSAALQLFQQRGFAAVSTRDLSEHAGLSRSHVYHYFSDWQTLRIEVFSRLAGEQLASLALALEGLEPEQALPVFIRECLPVEQDAGWALWLDAWDEALHDEDFAIAYRRENERWESILQSIIEGGIRKGVFRCDAADRAARQLLASVLGYGDQLLLKGAQAHAEQALAELLELARLLLKPSPP